MPAFPSSTTLTTDNLDNATDSPASARTEIKDSIDAVSDIIASYDQTSGIAALDSSGKIANTKLPSTLVTSSGNLVLDPSTDVVEIQNILQLTPQTTAQLTGIGSPATGSVAYCSDGDAGNPCIAVYTGSNWKVLDISDTNIATS